MPGLNDFGDQPDVRSWLYADAWLRAPSHEWPRPMLEFYYRGDRCRVVPITEPGLWLPLSCAIAIAAGGAAHTQMANTGNSPAIDCTGATLLVAVVWEGTSIHTIIDSQSNTWSQLTSQTCPSSGIGCIQYAANPSVSSSQTFNASTSTTPGLTVIAFTGVSATSPFDGQQNGVSSAGSPTQAGSVTPVNNSSLIIAGIGGLISVISAFSIDSGFTIVERLDVLGGVNYSSSIAYLVQSGSPSAVNPAWTWDNAANEGAMVACFKPAGTKLVLIPGR